MTESTQTTPANFLDRAKPLIERGFSIIPLTPRDKAPVSGLGAKSATNNADIIEHWGTAYPDANVGIASDANYTLLETDDETEFRALVRDLTGKELPETLRLGSGRPNRCCWVFKRTAACGNDCPELPGVFEFRNRNQYVAAPGSIHPQGHVYQWQNAAPVIEFPEWLMPAIVTMAKAYKGEATHDHIKTGPAKLLFNAYSIDLNPESMFGMDLQIGDGERHYALQSVAGFLHDGERDADDIYEILIALRDEYCTPGKGDHELRRIADDIVRRDPCVIEPANLSGMMVGKTIYREQAEYEAGLAEWEEMGWHSLFHTVDELLNAPPITFAIDRFLQADCVNMIGGLSGHGKTLIALAMTKALLEGGKLFDYFEVKGRSKRVIYLCPESSIGPFKDRLEKFGLIPHVRSKRLFVRTLNIGENLKLVDPMLQFAVRGADVFLDTATRFMEGDENSAEDQRVFANNMFALLRAGARTVTGLHHSSKAFRAANDITLENVLPGSGDLGAMLATCWGVLQMDEQSNRIHVKCVKARDFKPDGAFEIEGRPHIDETGYFKLTSRPGLTASLASQKQAGRGARGGRPESLDEDAVRWAMEQRAAGVKDRAIAEELDVSRMTLNRQLGPRVTKPPCD
jgi:hypothetical protein